MGMSASQVRFLTLQSRKNTIGRELSTLSNRKMALSRDMQNVSRKYTNALNQTNYKFSYDGGATYNDLTYATLMTPNTLNATTPYIITDANTGRVVLNRDALKDIDGNPITYNGQPVTYPQLANMISEYYVGFNSDDAYADGASLALTSGDANIAGYVVPSTAVDLGITDSNRMDIFVKLGIISQESMDKYLQAATQLYGGTVTDVSSAQSNVDTQVYPLGTAMGNLAFAEQNLAAFRAIKNQKFRTTFATNQTTYSNFDYGMLENFDVDYEYNSQNTKIYQKLNNAYSTDLQTHMNLAGTVDENNQNNASSYSFTVNDGNGFVMSINVSATGVDYQYTMNGIKNNNYQTILDNYHYCCTPDETDDRHSDFDYDDKESIYKATAETRRDNVVASIADYIDSCANVLKNSTNIELDNNKLTLAINKVKSVFNECINIEDSWPRHYEPGGNYAWYHNSNAFGNDVNNFRENHYVGAFTFFYYLDGTGVYWNSAWSQSWGPEKKSIGELLMLAYIDAANDTNEFETAFHKPVRTGTRVMDSATLTTTQLDNIFNNADKSVLFNLSENTVTSIENQLVQKVSDAQLTVKHLQEQIDSSFTSFEKKQMDFYDALFSKIAQSGWMIDDKTSATNANSTEYLNNKFQNNNYYISEANFYEGQAGYKFLTKIASNVVKIFSVHDSSAESAALAEYEAQKTLIHSKEQKIDTRMQKLETEQEAINTSMESIKKIIEDNISSTFKIFT